MLWNPLSGITSWIGNWFDGVILKAVSIFTILPTVLLYGLQLGFFYIIDCVQLVFRKMAGLDTYYVDGQQQSGDIVMSMLTNQMIVNIFIAVLVVSVMLLFVTTFVAIIRVEFTEKGAGNAKGPIIGRAVKSIAYFVIVPVTCLFGIWVANLFLRSFDKATSGSSYSLSTTVFFAAAQDANRARNNSDVAREFKDNADLMRALRLYGDPTQEEIAEAIDAAFLERRQISDTSVGSDSIELDTDDDAFSYYFAATLLSGASGGFRISSFDNSEMFMTMYFYDLFLGYNYMIGYVGGYMVAQLLVSAIIGLVQRIYELSILFVISPAAVAFMPLDDGKKYQSWRGEFIKRVGMMYGPIIGLNLMFQILAVLQHVTVFPSDTWDLKANLFNALMQLLFLIVGLLSVKEFSQIISSFVGSDDAAAKGEGKKGDVMKMGGRMMAGQMAAARMGKEVAKGAYNSVLGTRRAEKKAKDAEEEAKNNKDPKKQAALDAKAKALREKADKRKEAGKLGLGEQLNMAIKGDAAKTGIGGSFGSLAKSAGPALSFFTRDAIAERTKNGQSLLGQLRMFGTSIDANGKKNTDSLGTTMKKLATGQLQHVDDANRVISDGKEVKKAREDQELRHGIDNKMDNEAAVRELVERDYGKSVIWDQLDDANKQAFIDDYRAKGQLGVVDGSYAIQSANAEKANNANVESATALGNINVNTGDMLTAVGGAYFENPTPGSGAPGTSSGGGKGGKGTGDGSGEGEGGGAPQTVNPDEPQGGFNVRVSGGNISADIRENSKVTAKIDGTSNVNVSSAEPLTTALQAVVNHVKGIGLQITNKLAAVSKEITGTFTAKPKGEDSGPSKGSPMGYS